MIYKEFLPKKKKIKPQSIQVSNTNTEEKGNKGHNAARQNHNSLQDTYLASSEINTIKT